MNQKLDFIKLNDRIENVRQVLGEPKKESDYLGYKVLWYGSKDPFSGDLLYFENELLRLITSGVSEKTLKSYIDEHGIPSMSLSYYSGNLQRSDAKDTTVHIWNEKGLDVVTYGNIQQSEVLLERRYEPVASSEEYFLSTGKQFKDNERIEINFEFVPQELKRVRDYKIETQGDLSSGQLFYGFIRMNLIFTFVCLIIILLLSLSIFFVKKKLKKKRQIPTNNLPPTQIA